MRFLFDLRTMELVEARQYVRAFLPKDNQLIKTYSNAYPDDKVYESVHAIPIDLYHSVWLEKRIPESVWKSFRGVKPGTFYTKYNQGSVYIRIGQE